MSAFLKCRHMADYADIGIIPHMPIFKKCRYFFQEIPVPDAFSGTRNTVSAFILSHIAV